MAAPSQATIFAYNVGFGDCLLVRFTYPNASSRHVLIDFGSTKAALHGKPKSMLDVAKKIREHSGGKLEMLVATHRHADHISGFAGAPGAVIKDLKPEVVVQPWTEEPGLATDATKPSLAARGGGGNRALAAGRFTAQLDTLHLAAEQVLKQVPRIRQSKGKTSALADQLSFIGETNLKNLDAVKNLQKFGQRHVYASFGTNLKVGTLLPGVKVEVLGPPTLKQSPEIASMADTNAEEFWHLAPASGRRVARAAAAALFPRAKRTRNYPQEARWLIPQIERMEGEELLALVRILDGVMNNTSLILLFTIGETRLLFPGDAQLENWRYALTKAPNRDDIRERLSKTNVYKVGHHGSLNATPRKLLWKGFANAGADKRLITVLSTAAGKHGHVAQGTEVPRRTLVDELKARSTLFNTQDCTAKTGFFREVVVPL